MPDAQLFNGSFTSTGQNYTVVLPSGASWMNVYNLTQAAANQTTAVGVKYYWQYDMENGAKWTTFKSNAAAAANLEQYSLSNGFIPVNSSLNNPGNLNSTITAISNASIPVVTNSGTNNIVAGQIVRLINVVGAQQFGGVDFTVGLNTLSSTTFSLDYAPQIAAGTTGSWRVIPYDPIYYPRRRYITNITQDVNAVVTLSVTHGYQVGQSIRLIVPNAFGMVQANNLLGNILAVSTANNTITLDIDSSGFSAFAFPLSAAVPFTFAEVTPVGENTAVALHNNVNILSDATVNTAYLGMVLTGGVNCPGGANDDVMIWTAGVSMDAF